MMGEVGPTSRDSTELTLRHVRHVRVSELIFVAVRPVRAHWVGELILVDLLDLQPCVLPAALRSKTTAAISHRHRSTTRAVQPRGFITWLVC